MRIFGIDPGSVRTGYGCIEASGTRCALICSGAIVPPARSAFPDKLRIIYLELAERLADARPDCVAIESLFHGLNTRSAFALAHARGVMLLAATQLGCRLSSTRRPRSSARSSASGVPRSRRCSRW